MKKIFSLFLIAMLLLACLPALAEDAPAFSFRGGLTWGMTADQVIAIEGVEPDAAEEYSHHISKLVFHNRTVSAYTCTITYWFVDGGLAQSEILLDENWNYLEFKQPQIVTDLSLALSTVYGETINEENYALIDAETTEDMNADWEAILDGKAESNGGFQFTVKYHNTYCGWHPADGTFILISGHDEALYLHYLDYSIDWENAINEPAPVATPVPNTTGL